MSYQLLKQDVLFYQRFLKSSGFYPGELDGIWGPQTNKADGDFVAKTVAIAQQYGTFDSRSETNIITLIPKAQIEARKFLKLTRDQLIKVRIISGTRTYAEQDALFAMGRNENTQPIVTHSKGGQSNHNFGIAWDIGLFDGNGSYNTHDPDYIELAHYILPKISSVEWGGNWQAFQDYPHFQLKPVDKDVNTIRGLFESGQVYV